MRLFALFTALLTANLSWAQPIATDSLATQAAIIIDLSSGNTLYAYNADTRVTPASLTKLFTTAAAIELLGPAHKITTSVYLDGNDIIVRGHADPTVNSRYYSWHSTDALAQQIAEALKARGISSLANIHLDASFLSGSPLISKHLWEDIGNYYGATPSAFNIADNTQTIDLASPASPGLSCSVVAIHPNIGTLPSCYVKSYAKQADSVYVYGSGTDRYVSGCMPCNKTHFKVKASLPDPHLFFGQCLASSLKACGITTKKTVTNNAVPSSAQLIVSFASPSVESIAKTTNHESDNLYAESLLLQLSKGNSSSFDDGVKTLRSYVEGVTDQKALFYDGSGLSPMNATTPRQVVTLIRHMLTSQYAQQYANTLAKAGLEGTLKRIGRGTPVEGNVRGKSGSMTGVLGYAGTMTAASGRKLIFCIIINHSDEPNTSMRPKIAHWLENCISLY